MILDEWLLECRAVLADFLTDLCEEGALKQIVCAKLCHGPHAPFPEPAPPTDRGSTHMPNWNTSLSEYRRRLSQGFSCFMHDSLRELRLTERLQPPTHDTTPRADCEINHCLVKFVIVGKVREWKVLQHKPSR